MTSLMPGLGLNNPLLTKKTCPKIGVVVGAVPVLFPGGKNAKYVPTPEPISAKINKTIKAVSKPRRFCGGLFGGGSKAGHLGRLGTEVPGRNPGDMEVGWPPD